MPPLTNHMHEELASLTPILLVLFSNNKHFNFLTSINSTQIYSDKDNKIRMILKTKKEQARIHGG